MEDNQTEVAFSKNVIEMITVANNFCSFIEKADDSPKSEIFVYLEKVLPLLFLKGTLLPEVIVDDSEGNERFVTEEQWESIFNELRNKFDNDDNFWYLELNSPEPNEPLKANLSENLSDIYQDLKDFVLLYQKPTRTAKQNAAYECKKLFENNWGFKLINSLNAIHHILNKANNKDDNFDEFDTI